MVTALDKTMLPMFGKICYRFSKVRKIAVRVMTSPDQANENQQPVSVRDMVLELNFVPAWAREAPQRPAPKEEEHHREKKRGDRGRGRRERRKLSENRGALTAEKPATQARKQFPVRVFFLPERTALGIAARDLHVSRQAMPLDRLAQIFLGSSDSCLVKIELVRNPQQPTDESQRLFWCAECRQVFREYAGALAHVTGAHLELRFRREERIGEPPSGQFVCIGRCRLSGELLGPPNHHAYNERLMDLYRRRFSHLSLDEYRRQIEMVRDPQIIEEWREKARRKDVFIPISPEDGTGEMSRREAERIFAERYAKEMIRASVRVVVPMRVGGALEDSVLSEAVRTFADREKRKPISMTVALRAAFNHMGFHFFHARGQTFVTAVEPRPLNPDHAIPDIADLLRFVERHPGCTRHELLAQLLPNCGPESPESMELLRHLSWLIGKGHVIEFFNGTLAIPRLPGPPATK